MMKSDAARIERTTRGRVVAETAARSLSWLMSSRACTTAGTSRRRRREQRIHKRDRVHVNEVGRLLRKSASKRAVASGSNGRAVLHHPYGNTVMLVVYRAIACTILSLRPGSTQDRT